MLLIGLFQVPAYLQLAPLPEEPYGSGNATDYQRQIGITGISPLRGTLRAAPGNPGTEVSLYPTSPSWRTAAPHGSLASLLIARFREEGLGGRRQVASRKEERSAALDILFSRYCEAGLDWPLHFTTDIF